MNYNEVKGNLIILAMQGNFDAIAHGCNCFNIMGAGLAPQMDNAFGCNNSTRYTLEHPQLKGNPDKLGRVQHNHWNWVEDRPVKIDDDLSEYLIVVNAYTQYYPGSNLDYEAFTLCLRKLNILLKGKHIGLPQIGCGIAGGDWEKVKEIIKTELKDCNVTVVIYDQN